MEKYYKKRRKQKRNDTRKMTLGEQINGRQNQEKGNRSKKSIGKTVGEKRKK